MRNHTILLSLLASLTASGCSAVECAEGTIERDGKCEPPDDGFTGARCGDFTHLEGDRCVPDYPPVVCQGGMTAEDPDNPGVLICIGGGDTDCASPITCPTPLSANKQTICGQIYDFEAGTPPQKFQTNPAMPLPTRCIATAPAAAGPCALTMVAYDALAFGMSPTTTQPLPIEEVTIDECGRFRLQNIDLTNAASPFIGIGVDDAGMPLGAGGITVTAAVAAGKQGMTATRDVEAFIVKPSTTTAWTASGGPPLSGGIYAPVYRAHKLPSTAPFDPQPGVTFTKGGNPVPNNDFYFQAAQLTRTTIDPAATATGANGTALITSATVADSIAYAGSGGLGAGCRWEPHAGASLPSFGGIVFIQIFRKIDILGQTCND
jgi:hypothetical protein